jgi:hypothetical protein
VGGGRGGRGSDITHKPNLLFIVGSARKVIHF